MARARKCLAAALVLFLVVSSHRASAAPPEGNAIEEADICAVLADPFSFDHKLLRLTGSVARDFETFWITSSKCPDAHPIWIEYGGPRPADGPIWHPGPEHPSTDGPLCIEGISATLTVDRKFEKFDSMTKSLKRGKNVRATLVGWLVAAKTYKTEAGDQEEVGYGPYQMYSLFVIQKVDEVSRR